MNQDVDWTKKHILRLNSKVISGDVPPNDAEARKAAEPWLSALLQAEHVNLLLGSGFTAGVAHECGAGAAGMAGVSWKSAAAPALDAAAKEAAAHVGRAKPNVEDQIRVARQALDGLRILSLAGDDDSWKSWAEPASKLRDGLNTEFNTVLLDFLISILDTESAISVAIAKSDAKASVALRLLGSFLLTFSSRAASRERLNLFTTNYDRLIEFGADILGLRILDRFVGTLTPVFRSSRLGLDLHYNPPGIRGEPRYLEGVIRLTKLHGSVDWRHEAGPHGIREVHRTGIPFGAPKDHPGVPANPADSLMIYPNPAKDIETLEYPYADLFRDFAAATCLPNGVLFTYGYGFGDDHVNRTIRDMLTIPSTHLVIISFDGAGGRIERFCADVGREDQISLLIGSHAGSLPTLVEHYLPKPAIDRNTWKMMELLARRHDPRAGHRDDDKGALPKDPATPGAVGT